MRDDRRTDVEVGTQPADVVEVRVRADQPPNRFVRRQIRDFLDDRQTPCFVPGRLEHGHEITELHHVAVGRTTTQAVDAVGQFLDDYRRGERRLRHRRWHRGGIVAYVRLHVGERSPVGVVARALPIELPVVVPTLV